MSSPSASTLDTDDKAMRLVVEVKAHLDWREPPANDQEKIMREVANNEVAFCADEIREAVQLLVAILLTKRRG